VNPRIVITAVALVFVCAMAFGTVYVLLTDGATVISLIGVVVVLLLAFGVFGALSEPTDRRRR
jgi:hypothetical protein